MINFIEILGYIGIIVRQNNRKYYNKKDKSWDGHRWKTAKIKL